MFYIRAGEGRSHRDVSVSRPDETTYRSSDSIALNDSKQPKADMVDLRVGQEFNPRCDVPEWQLFGLKNF